MPAWLRLRVARNGGGAADTAILSMAPNSAPELRSLRRRISPCIGFCAPHFVRRCSVYRQLPADCRPLGQSVNLPPVGLNLTVEELI